MALRNKDAMNSVKTQVINIAKDGNAYKLSPEVFTDLQYMVKNQSMLDGIVESICILEYGVSEGYERALKVHKPGNYKSSGFYV